ncbi:MAG: hypothetical protein QXW47_09765 [Candidatus Jordarchaeales archaeon]|nr:hypothetical protein [Candidatus Jordarchaeia archaeon]
MEELDSDSSNARSGLLPVLVELKRRLEDVYGNELIDLIPLGVGRSEDSADIDVAVVLKKKEERLNSDTKSIHEKLEKLIKRKKINLYVVSPEKLEFVKWPLYLQKKWRKRQAY